MTKTKTNRYPYTLTVQGDPYPDPMMDPDGDAVLRYSSVKEAEELLQSKGAFLVDPGTVVEIRLGDKVVKTVTVQEEGLEGVRQAARLGLLHSGPPEQGTTNVEATTATVKQIQQAWPEVAYKGVSFFEPDDLYGKIYKAAAWLLDLNSPDWSGQEIYLGWLPDSDLFVMGFDIWPRETDEDEGQPEMEAWIVELSVQGKNVRAERKDITPGPGGFYPQGLAYVHQRYRGIKDLRLDRLSR